MNTGSKAVLSAVLVLLASMPAMDARAADTRTPGVLILHSNQRPLAAGVIIDDTLRDLVPSAMERPVELYSEYLDSEWPSDKEYGAAQAELLSKKYGRRNIRVVVTSAPLALRFAVEFRHRAFAGVPLVHVAVPRDALERMRLPTDVFGSPTDLDPAPTLRLALGLHPHAKRLVIVLGAAERDRAWERRVRAAIDQLRPRIDVEFLKALAAAEVERRLGALPRDAIVFTPGYFSDGTGRVITPQQSVERIARASAAPVYGTLDTFLGTGIVGGYMVPYEEQARAAGAIVTALLTGAVPATIKPTPLVQKPLVDWRQMRRWGIDESLLPAETVVRFREPTVWQQYWRELALGAAVLLLQAGLIVALLLQRHWRQRTELRSAQDRAALRHMTRVSMMGQLSAAIAHQLNQPLAAILGNAEAAQSILDRERVDLAELREICGDIVSENHRATDIIRRLRVLYGRGEMKLERIDLNEVIRETLDLLRTELLIRHVVPNADLAGVLPSVQGERVQLQQVVLNLVLNAVDAMGKMEPKARKLTIRTDFSDGTVNVHVIDSGPGIAPDHLNTVFEPFWSGKPGGMGIGLAVCQSIVAAHRGGITAANNAEGGANFRVSLPAGQRP